MKQFVMRYFIRAIKYFVYFSLMLVVMMAALYAMNMTDSTAQDFPSMFFRNGYDSLKLIILVFAGVSAIYPLVGFTKTKAIVPGEEKETAKTVTSYMEERGYVLEKTEGADLSFRARSLGKKILRMFEDRIIFQKDFSGYLVKGMRKDVVRIVHGVEVKARANED